MSALGVNQHRRLFSGCTLMSHWLVQAAEGSPLSAPVIKLDAGGDTLHLTQQGFPDMF